MQFLILLLGVLVFSFYTFTNHPATFNTKQLEVLNNSEYAVPAAQLQSKLDSVQASKQVVVKQWMSDRENTGLVKNIKDHLAQEKVIQDSVKSLVRKVDALAETTDTNYIFLKFVIDHLPVGLVGLLIAVIFLAGWGSIAAALNSLASTTVVDLHKKFVEKECSAQRDYKLSKRYTFAWGVFCMITAMFATKMGSLIEAVNVLGSLFYGVILGVFLVAFYMKKVGSNAVFWAAVISEAITIILFILGEKKYIGLGFLWLTLLSGFCVVILAWIFSLFLKEEKKVATA